MLEGKDKSKILYLHGRPSPHPLHERLAKAVGSVFYPVDHFMRWQDKQKSVAYRIVSSIVNAFLYPLRKYDIILVDNLHIAPIIAKKLRLFVGRKKYVAHLGSHTLFFLFNHQYSPFVKKIHVWALGHYDVLICEGEMAKELVCKILPTYSKKIEVSFLGPKHERNLNLIKLTTPNLTSHKILIIANGPGEFRKYYKGLDMMISAFSKALSKRKELELEIIGTWDNIIINECLKNLPEGDKHKISFTGATDDIEAKLTNASLLLHCSRGDAFPTSTIESMAGGVPVLVSVWTGTKQLVKEVDEQFIVDLDEETIAERMDWYYSLPLEQRRRYSSEFREVALKYTEELAIERYQRIVDGITK